MYTYNCTASYIYILCVCIHTSGACASLPLWAATSTAAVFYGKTPLRFQGSELKVGFVRSFHWRGPLLQA